MNFQQVIALLRMLKHVEEEYCFIYSHPKARQEKEQ
jgi:hypothetical protein